MLTNVHIGPPPFVFQARSYQSQKGNYKMSAQTTNGHVVIDVDVKF